MFTKKIIPHTSEVMLQLPEDLIGQEVTLIAVVETSDRERIASGSKAERLKKIENTFEKYQIDMSDYTFDRDEANNYE